MMYRGHVKNGMVVLDDAVTLPEGIPVQVHCLVREAEQPALDDRGETIGQKLSKYAGKATGLPIDASRNHDHYLYGKPKKP